METKIKSKNALKRSVPKKSNKLVVAQTESATKAGAPKAVATTAVAAAAKEAPKRVAPKKSNKLAPNFNPNTATKPASQNAMINTSVDQMTSRDFQLDTHAHIDVTAQLLKDHVRLNNFRVAIDMNRHLFRDKIVLDIGCGIGILSLFAAKAGAARVFAVDPSNVVDYTRNIVSVNHYEHIIEVIKGRIEDVCLPVAKVDLIVCDWMGYSLLYQSLCASVIYARDRWLRRDGIIFPDVAKLYIAAVADSERKNEKIEWWKNVYGFNMKSVRESAVREPSIHAVQPDQVLSSDFNIKTINMNTAKLADLGFCSKYMLRMIRSGLVDGVVTYFQVHFSKSHTPMGLSTSPWSPHTHWMQTVFFFDQPIAVNADKVLCGGFEMMPANRTQPCLNHIEVALELFNGDPLQLQVEMHWHMKPHTAATNIIVQAVDKSDADVVSVAKQKQQYKNNNIDINSSGGGIAEKMRKTFKAAVKKG